MKLVSVIIPTYNSEKFISKTIDSCLRQTHSEIEILIIDDNSLDGTKQVIKSYKDPRIKYYLHERNLGVAASRNTGIRNASGDFIAFLDHDDEWMPEKTAHQLEVFKNSALEIGLVFTTGCSEYAHNLIKEKAPTGIVYNPKKDSFFPLKKSIAPPSSWMLPRAVVNEIGDFDTSIYSWDDCDYSTRVSLKYPVYFLNENLVIWHILPGHLGIVSYKTIKGKEIFLNKYFDFIKKDRKYLSKFYKAIGKDAIFIDKNIARKYLFKALLMRPLDLSIIGKLARTLGNKIPKNNY